MNGRPSRRHRGFTLVEAAFVTVVVGLSCAALLQLLAAGTVANVESAELTSAVNVANNLHEGTISMTFAQVAALNNKDYSPPVDSRMTAIASLGSTWKQHVDVAYVDPQNLSALSGTGATAAARVTVTVYHNSNKVYDTRWVICNVP